MDEVVSLHGALAAVTCFGNLNEQGRQLIWAHGWGQSGAAFLPLAKSFEHYGSSILMDLPGFGRSSPPPAAWGTAEYADAIAEWLSTTAAGSRVWIGHSFGCRIGIQVAARHPGLLDGMILIAAAGLRRRRSLWQKIKFNGRVYSYKIAKRLTPEGPARDRLRERFGSADYRNAGPMRPVFTKVIAEDLTEVARTISCRCLLLYGKNDDETPPEFGERFARLIKGGRLVLLAGYGHIDILTRGQHQVANEIRKFLDALP